MSSVIQICTAHPFQYPSDNIHVERLLFSWPHAIPAREHSPALMLLLLVVPPADGFVFCTHSTQMYNDVAAYSVMVQGSLPELQTQH